ncbi:phage baseplate assembly protein V [Pseudomonas koreensis]|uniref:phage baseplate assembly protein V n=1 Tax=Pseudomonas koreensis TaxID=198620 RepID=UPI003F87A261
MAIDSFKLGGKALPNAVRVITLEILHGVNQVPEARVLLRSEELCAGDAFLCRPGTSVKFSYGHKPSTLTFEGEVTRQDLSVEANHIEYRLVIRHTLQRLQLNRRSRIFAAHSTEQQVLTQVLGTHTVQFELGEQLNHAQMVQFDCSDWQFLQARLRATGAWMMVKEQTISIRRPQVTKADHIFKGRGKGGNLLVERMDWKFNNTHLAHDVMATSWDITEQQPQKTRSGGADIGSGALAASELATNAGPWELTHSQPLPERELHGLASSNLLGKRAAAVQGDVVVEGGIHYAVGQTIAFEGFGNAIDGKALISAVKHVIKATAGAELAWRTTLSIGHVDWHSIQSAVIPTAPGLHVGKVTAYPNKQASVDQADLIQVKLPVLGEHALLWARFSSPSASVNSGQCLYPEIGDEVVLGFFEDDPRYPIILGSMFNPHSKAPFAPGTGEKGWVFEHAGGRQALLFNVKDHVLTLESQQAKNARVIINSSGQVEVVAQQHVQVTAQQSLELEGKSGVRIKGSRVDLNS